MIRGDERLGCGDAFVACTYSHLQMKKEALTTLKRAAEAGFSEWDLAARDPDLACLREEPEFKRMLERGK